jgi:hypothetical protein
MSLPGGTRIINHPVGRKGQKGPIILKIGGFMIFLGLVNPLFWASIIRGMNAEIIIMNSIFSGLILVFGATLIRIGSSRITRDLRDSSEQENHSHNRQQ